LIIGEKDGGQVENGSVKLKSNFEILVPGVKWYFFDFGFPDVVGKGLFNVPQTIVNVVRSALCEHLNGAIHQVSDQAG